MKTLTLALLITGPAHAEDINKAPAEAASEVPGEAETPRSFLLPP
jgi:hypothetical protein